MTKNQIDKLAQDAGAHTTRTKYVASVAAHLGAEAERLEPIAKKASEFAERLASGEHSKSLTMEVAAFLNVPNQDIATLHLFLNELDDRF